MAARELVCVCVWGWVVCARYHYTTQSLIGIWRRKLISPSAVALACVSVRKRVCVLPKGKGEGAKKMKRRIFHLIVSRLNFWLVWKVMLRDVTAAILAQRLLSTFLLRRSYREKCGALGGSTDCDTSSSSSSLLSQLGWRECCSWLTRNNDNQVLSIYLSIYQHTWFMMSTLKFKIAFQFWDSE